MKNKYLQMGIICSRSFDQRWQGTNNKYFVSVILTFISYILTQVSVLSTLKNGLVNEEHSTICI